jgi:hypothetical protein
MRQDIKQADALLFYRGTESAAETAEVLGVATALDVRAAFIDAVVVPFVEAYTRHDPNHAYSATAV